MPAPSSPCVKSTTSDVGKPILVSAYPVPYFICESPSTQSHRSWPQTQKSYLFSFSRLHSPQIHTITGRPTRHRKHTAPECSAPQWPQIQVRQQSLDDLGIAQGCHLRHLRAVDEGATQVLGC